VFLGFQVRFPFQTERKLMHVVSFVLLSSTAKGFYSGLNQWKFITLILTSFSLEILQIVRQSMRGIEV